MKTILTLLLAFGCTAASAQKFMIGLHGGVQANGTPMGTGGNLVTFDNVENPVSPLFGLRLGLGFGKLQAGGGIQFTRLTPSYEQVYKNTGVAFVTSEAVANVPTFYLFLNLTKNISRLQLFYGINAGYVQFTGTATETTWGSQFKVAGSDIGPNGFCAGVQAGGRVGLYKGLGVFVEAGARYNSVSFPMQAYDVMGNSLGTFRNGSFLSFPILAGVDYRL